MEEYDVRRSSRELKIFLEKVLATMEKNEYKKVVLSITSY